MQKKKVEGLDGVFVMQQGYGLEITDWKEALLLPALDQQRQLVIRMAFSRHVGMPLILSFSLPIPVCSSHSYYTGVPVCISPPILFIASSS